MSTSTPNLGLTLPTPNVDTGWGGALNTDFTTIDSIFGAAGDGLAVGLNVGNGKTLTLGGTVIIGRGDNTGSVTPPTIRGAARTGTNAQGANITIDAANGTGTGGSGSIIFRTAPPGAAGTIANTMQNVMEIKADGTVVVGSTNIATLFQPGMMMEWAALGAPSGWLLCDGSAINRTTYAALFAVIGTTYGAGDGISTFNVPDARGRATVGKDNMGGVAAGRVTTAKSGIDGNNLGAAGGLEDHVLTIGQIAAHQHFIAANASGAGAALSASNYVQKSHNYSSNDDYILRGDAAEPTLGLSSVTGGGGPHNNMQPTIIVNKIIKY